MSEEGGWGGGSMCGSMNEEGRGARGNLGGWVGV